jgi:hypothetical protein
VVGTLPIVRQRCEFRNFTSVQWKWVLCKTDLGPKEYNDSIKLVLRYIINVTWFDTKIKAIYSLVSIFKGMEGNKGS